MSLTQPENLTSRPEVRYPTTARPRPSGQVKVRSTEILGISTIRPDLYLRGQVRSGTSAHLTPSLPPVSGGRRAGQPEVGTPS